jgi:hypothetical protein
MPNFVPENTIRIPSLAFRPSLLEISNCGQPTGASARWSEVTRATAPKIEALQFLSDHFARRRHHRCPLALRDLGMSRWQL